MKDAVHGGNPDSGTVARWLLSMYLLVYALGLYWPNLGVDAPGNSLLHPTHWLPGSFSWYLHAGGHLVLTLLVLAVAPRWQGGWRLGVLMLGLLTFAAAAEAMQAWVPGRTPLVVDFLFNALGVALGAMLFTAARLVGGFRPGASAAAARGR